MTLMEHVALALDFSEPSKVAAKAVFRLAELASTKRITTLHSLRKVILPPGDHPKMKARLSNLQDRLHSAAMEQIDELCGEIGKPAIPVQREIVEGTPSRVIPEAAIRVGATVLAMGTHSRQGVSRWLMGSIAEEMCRGVRLPALVLPTGEDGIPPDKELEELDRVLVAVDLFERAFEVVRVGVEAARAFTSKPKLTLLAVSDLPAIPDTGSDDVAGFKDILLESAQEGLDELKEKYATDDLEIDTCVVDGEPDERILEVAERLEANLVVIGTHGRGQAPLLELGSTTSQVIRRSDVSVLVVPSHPDEEQV